MKSTRIPLAIAAIAAALFVFPAEADAQKIGEVYRAARTAFERGDYENAAKMLDQVIAADPSYVPARALRAQVQIKIDARGAGDAMKKKCDATTIPKIDFADVELKLALEALAISTADATGGKFRPNFILNGGDEVGNRRVSLQLRGAPLSTVLEYIGKIANVSFRYERFAVVGVPLHTTGSAFPPEAAPDADPPLPPFNPEDPFKKGR